MRTGSPGEVGRSGCGRLVRVRWIRGFIWPTRAGNAMDTLIHTRFPRWIRASIAGTSPARRDGSGHPSQARRPPGHAGPGPGAGQARAERAVTAATREPDQAAPSTAHPTPPADQAHPEPTMQRPWLAGGSRKVSRPGRPDVVVRLTAFTASPGRRRCAVGPAAREPSVISTPMTQTLHRPAKPCVDMCAPLPQLASSAVAVRR